MTYLDPIYGVYSEAGVFTPPPYDPLNYSTLTEGGYLTVTAGWAATFNTYPLPNSFTGKTTIRTALGAGVIFPNPYHSSRRLDLSIGLYQVDNQDPTIYGIQTKATGSIGMRAARSALPAGAARRMYFAIDHNWNYQMGGATHIGVSVWYYDLGFNGTTDKISLVYDGQGGTTTHATTYTLGNTATWMEAVWPITDAYFGGRLLTLNGSTFGDFYITHPDSADLWVSEVIVTQATTTDTTYYYLVGSNNTTNVQRQLSSRTLHAGRVQGASIVSATGSYTPSGGSSTSNP